MKNHTGPEEFKPFPIKTDFGYPKKKQNHEPEDCNHSFTKMISGYTDNEFIIQTKCIICNEVLESEKI